MQDTYVIIWIARDKDSSGVGKKRLTKDDAEALAQELNSDHPAFLHRALDTQTEEPAAALLLLRQSLAGVSSRLTPLPEFGSVQAAAVEAPLWEEPKAPAKEESLIQAA